MFEEYILFHLESFDPILKFVFPIKLPSIKILLSFSCKDPIIEAEISRTFIFSVFIF